VGQVLQTSGMTHESVSPDEHDDSDFSDVVPDNFPRLLDHLDLLGAEETRREPSSVSTSSLGLGCRAGDGAAHVDRGFKR